MRKGERKETAPARGLRIRCHGPGPASPAPASMVPPTPDEAECKSTWRGSAGGASKKIIAWRGGETGHYGK